MPIVFWLQSFSLLSKMQRENMLWDIPFPLPLQSISSFLVSTGRMLLLLEYEASWTKSNVFSGENNSTQKNNLLVWCFQKVSKINCYFSRYNFDLHIEISKVLWDAACCKMFCMLSGIWILVKHLGIKTMSGVFHSVEHSCKWIKKKWRGYPHKLF